MMRTVIRTDKEVQELLNNYMRHIIRAADYINEYIVHRNDYKPSLDYLHDCNNIAISTMCYFNRATDEKLSFESLINLGYIINTYPRFKSSFDFLKAQLDQAYYYSTID